MSAELDKSKDASARGAFAASDRSSVELLLFSITGVKGRLGAKDSTAGTASHQSIKGPARAAPGRPAKDPAAVVGGTGAGRKILLGVASIATAIFYFATSPEPVDPNAEMVVRPGETLDQAAERISLARSLDKEYVSRALRMDLPPEPKAVAPAH